jgi:hypothetical protein
LRGSGRSSELLWLWELELLERLSLSPAPAVELVQELSCFAAQSLELLRDD